MSARAHAAARAAASGSAVGAAIGSLLQRKCACGGTAGVTGDCAACRQKRLGLQTKLKINEPGDVYEQEADRVADLVTTGPARSALRLAPPRIQRVSPVASGPMDTTPASVDRTLASPGRPLDRGLRRDMEQRFGHDFSTVRVHTDAAAAQSAQDVDAHAYTFGHDVVFDANRFAPGTSDGRHLLAHELTHVVQQAGGRGGPSASLQRQPAPTRRVSTDNQFELLNQIQGEFDRPQPREARLTEAFNALEPSSAALVQKAIVSGKVPAFQKLPPDVGKRLRALLAQRLAAVPVLSPGIYGKGVRRLAEWDYFVVRDGVTIDEIANYLSDDPKLASVMETRNKLAHDQVLAAGTVVYFPLDSFKRPGARQQLSQDLRSGSFIHPWGAFEVSHTEPRTYHRGDVLLTRSEFESLQENELEQKHGADAGKQIAAAKEANRPKQLKEDAERAKKVPNSLLTFFFPTSRLYFKDQSSLIENAWYRSQYQTNLRGFDTGTNLYREAGAAAVAVNMLPLAILESYAAVGLLGELGAGEGLTYGARYVYLNAPTLYGDAMFYLGAGLTGAALGQHLLEVRSRGVELGDLPRLAEDLTPFFGGWSESQNMRRSTTLPTPDASDQSTSLTSSSRPTFGGRWLRNLYLATKLTVDDVVPEHGNIAGGGNYGRPTPALVQSGSQVTTSAPISDPATQPDLPSMPTSVTTPAPVTASAPPIVTAPATTAGVVAPVATPAYVPGAVTIGFTPIGVNAGNPAPLTSRRQLQTDVPQQGTQMGSQTQIGPEIVTAINGVAVTSRDPNVLVGADTARFRADALAIILTDANHPLAALVDYTSQDWVARPYQYGNMLAWEQNPIDWQAGHGISNNLGGADVIILQSRYRNQIQSARLERTGAVSKDEYYDIGGIAVDPLTAWDLYNRGLLPLPPTSYPKFKL